MKFLLIGAGAVGCWIGANLMRASHTVAFVGRDRFIDTVCTGGLRIHLPNADAWHLPNVVAHTRIDDALSRTQVDAVIVCMKAYAVSDAIQDLRAQADALSGVLFLPFQNGVGSDDLFASAFGETRVMAATLTSPVSLEAPNGVRLERARGGVGLALLPPGGAEGGAPMQAFADVARAFASAPLLHARTYSDAHSLRWSKLLLNIVGNATSAILDKTVAEIYADPIWSQVELRMLRECVRVIDAQDITVVNLPGAPATWLARAIRILPDAVLRPVMLRAFARARGDKRPSFFYDVANRTGRSEVGWLNGSIVNAGGQVRVPTPVNQVLTETLEALVKPDSALTRAEARDRLAACAHRR